MASDQGEVLGKSCRGCRGLDAGATPSRPPVPIAGSRRNCITGGFPGPKARPSVIFSSHKLGVTVGGCAAFYSAVLSCQPDHPVTICPGNLPACIRVSPSLLVFTRDNWMTPQFFRVAVLSGIYDDNNKDDRKLQVIEHVGSSMDTRFNGNKILYLPSTVLVQISGREGCYMFSSGKSIATALQLGKGSSPSWQTQHAFSQIELEVGPTLPPRESSSKSSVCTFPAAVDAANTLPHAAATSSLRRNLTGSFSSASLAPSGQSIQSAGDGYYHASAKDGSAMVKVACRATHTVVLYKSGKWGLLGKMDVDYTAEKNDQDTTGINGNRGSNSALSKMLIDIECGDAHIVSVTEQGYLMTWGEGRDGRLGHGDSYSIRAPHAIKSLFHKRIVHIACGARHTVALAEDGDVFSWGDGKCGALGHGLNEREQLFDSVNMPMEILSLKNKGVARISCGDMHTAVVLLNGSVLTCGWGEYGRLGRPCRSECSSTFEKVHMSKKLCTFVACGAAHTLVLTECKSIYAFGWNVNGQLGLGDRRNRPAPTKIQYFATDDLVVSSMTAGKLHSMVTTQDARVFAWGSDELGQCGIGSFPQIYTVPHLVASTVGVNVTQISAGEGHSVVLSTASQKQLDAMEANHPSRYATLMESFESFVKSDRELQAKVLAFAKESHLKREAARRKRKPPIDPSSSLARTLQLQCQLQSEPSRVEKGVDIMRGTGEARSKPICRPHTAGAVLSSGSSRASHAKDKDCPVRQVEQTPNQIVPDQQQQKSYSKNVRCSSASLWRQTRLFTFQSPVNAMEPQQKSPTKAKDTLRFANGDKSKADAPSGLRRPMSASVNMQPKLSAEARRSLASMLNGESDIRMRQKVSSASDGATSSANRNGHRHFDSPPPPGDQQNESLASFPVSRPKSAPSRAVVRSK